MKLPFSNFSGKTRWTIAALLLGCSFMSPRAAHADTIGYNVTIDTSTLNPANPGGYGYYFTMGNDDAFNDNTTVTIDNFTSSGGSTYTGSTAPVTLTDFTNSTNDTVTFNAGGKVSFNFTSSTVPSGDSFFLSIFDSPSTFANTDDPGTNDYLLEYNFGTGAITTHNFTPFGPVPSVTVTATPEPATWAMMALGLGVMAVMMGRAQRRRDEEMS